DPGAAVGARDVPGGPAPDRVRHQLDEAAATAGELQVWLDALEPPPIYQAHLEGRLLDGQLA
ncbi:MAG: hypothetical protein ACOC83_03920, partial [Gemmatimonadota bacterium]